MRLRIERRSPLFREGDGRGRRTTVAALEGKGPQLAPVRFEGVGWIDAGDRRIGPLGSVPRGGAVAPVGGTRRGGRIIGADEIAIHRKVLRAELRLGRG